VSKYYFITYTSTNGMKGHRIIKVPFYISPMWVYREVEKSINKLLGFSDDWALTSFSRIK
jgi:hypothetical protein